MKRDIRMAIIRPIGNSMSRNFYNSQEIGLARGLSCCGICVDVYVAGTGPEVVCQEIAARGSGVVRLFEVPFFLVPEIDHALYPKLQRLLEDGRYDFIQVNEENELTSFLVARFARRRGIPVVVYQGMYEQLTGRIRAAFQSCYDRLLLPAFRRNVSLALTKTSRARRHLERKGFARIEIVPVGLDPSPFETQVDRDWRQEYDIPEDHAIILYVGIFERRRNVDFMVELAQRLSEQKITLVMAGGGPEHDRIAARIAGERIANVRLVGKVAQECLPSLYRQSSLFLLPSNYEIYGMVVLEAMYFGVPVLSTRTAGPEDIIDTGVDGVLFESLDLELWAWAIGDIIDQPGKLTAMAQSADRKVRNNLTWNVIASEYNARVIECLLAK